MDAKPEQSASAMPGNWTISTWPVWGSPIRPIFPASPPCLQGHSSDGLAVWPEYPARDCQNKSSSLASWKMASDRKVAQKKHYKATLKASMKSFGFDPKSWVLAAQDRPAWRRKVKEGAVLCEGRRSSSAMLKRQQRKSAKKGLVAAPQSSTSSLTCPCATENSGLRLVCTGCCYWSKAEQSKTE